MSVLRIKQKGDYSRFDTMLRRIVKADFASKLREYGEWGVYNLYKATPKDTGETARSWRYVIERQPGKVTISWVNDHAPRGVQVAVLIQFGHATKNGGWVEGIDYINPALAPVFEAIANELWEEVTKP